MNDELYHHGTKGMHWGVRRYQNPDGTLTDAGKKRYNSGADTSSVKRLRAKSDTRPSHASVNRGTAKLLDNPEPIKQKTDYKKIALIGAAAVGTAVLGYEIYKHRDQISSTVLSGKKAAERLYTYTIKPKAYFEAQRIKNITIPAMKSKAIDVGRNAVNRMRSGIKEAGKNLVKEGKSAAKMLVTDAKKTVLRAAGVYLVAKMFERYEANKENQNKTDAQKKIDKFLLDEAAKYINAKTGNSKNNNDQSNSNKNAKSRLSDSTLSKVGPPARKPIDKSSASWSNLFKDKNGQIRSEDTRSFIKDLANDGYSVSQIEYILNLEGMSK